MHGDINGWMCLAFQYIFVQQLFFISLHISLVFSWRKYQNDKVIILSLPLWSYNTWVKVGQIISFMIYFLFNSSWTLWFSPLLEHTVLWLYYLLWTAYSQADHIVQQSSGVNWRDGAPKFGKKSLIIREPPMGRSLHMIVFIRNI